MKKVLLTITALVSALIGANAQEYLNIGGKAIPVSEIKSIKQHSVEDTRSLSRLIEADERISLFCEALTATGVMNLLKVYADPTYSVGSDSIDWTNPALVIPTSMECDNVAYMEHRHKKRTVFAVPDSVLMSKYGISNLEGLKSLAKQLYDPMYPEDASITDLTDRHNSLNRFVSYHILPFSAGYYQLTAMDGGTLEANWDRKKIDITDWYETMMPHSTLKCSFPSGKEAGLYINRRGVQSRADERGIFVRGSKVTAPEEMPVDNQATNGIYHYIDDIVAYDKTTQQEVFDERMRIDCTTLSPDFMTSGARGHHSRKGMYGTYGSSFSTSNSRTCLGFKAGSVENFKFDGNETHLHVRNRTPSYWSYQGDEMAIMGRYDVTVKLPPLPAGKYEIRLGACVNFSDRGLIQFYLGDNPDSLQPAGVPVDMRKSAEQLCNWKSDSSLGNEERIAEDDRRMRNLGWLKGPKSYYSASSESGGTKSQCFRDLSMMLRYIIGTFTTDGSSDQYLRMQQVDENAWGDIYLPLDYIEIVPSTVYDNPEIPEDRW